jgi:Growth inhibitor
MNYIPKKGDLIYIDFDPSRGKEIQKRRPAIVMSNDDYNRVTGFCLVIPITKVEINMPFRFTLTNYKITGQVNTLQEYTFDYHFRNAKYKDKIRNIDYHIIYKMMLEKF